MAKTVAVRTGKDRVRYSILLEVGIMAFLIPAGAAFFDKSLADIGLLGLTLSLKAVLVGLIYNWAVDKIGARNGHVSSDRKTIGRILHAVGFEMSLLITSLPIYTIWLGLTILQALAADLVITSFVVVFTYFFTLGYDRMFPVLPREGVQ